MKIDRMLTEFGRFAEFVSADGETVIGTHAFISPLRYKNKMYLYGVNTEIGYNSQGYYLYIGPPDSDLTLLSDGSYISCADKKYRIDRAEKVYKGSDVFYIWAIVREIVEIEEEES